MNFFIHFVQDIMEIWAFNQFGQFGDLITQKTASKLERKKEIIKD